MWAGVRARVCVRAFPECLHLSYNHNPDSSCLGVPVVTTDNLGEFDAEREMELSTCWGRYTLLSWLRTRMVLEATAPSRDRSPPSCPRLSRLPSPSSQELRTSPLGWLLYGSPCTGPCNSGRCPTTTSTTRSPSPPASVRWCTGELLDRAEGARHSRSVDSGLLLPPWVPPGLREVTSVTCQGCPQGAAELWTTWRRGQTRDFAGRCFGSLFLLPFFFPLPPHPEVR